MRRRPARALSTRERTLIVEGQEAALVKHRRRPPLGELLRRRNLWAIAAARSWPIRSGACCRCGSALLVQARHFRPDPDRDVRLAALPGRRSGLPVRPGCRRLPATARRQLIDARRVPLRWAVLMTGMMFVGSVGSPSPPSRCCAWAVSRTRRCRSPSSRYAPTCSRRIRSSDRDRRVGDGGQSGRPDSSP